MKRAFLALAFLLLLATSTWAQTPPCLEADTVVDTVQLQLSLSTTEHLVWDFYLGRAASGRMEYAINPASIKFSGSCSNLNTMSTSQIFDMIATATVSQGVGLGFTTCPSSCTSPSITKVFVPGCVHRSGSDADTRFEPCPSTPCCVRTYSVCCPNGTGSPVITLLSSQSSSCTPSSYCESTCP